MISKENYIDNKIINSLISELIKDSYKQDSEKIVIQMKKIVPEYKSLNSVYSKLD